MTYSLRLLGRFQLSAPNGSEITVSAKKNKALVAVLSVAAGEWVPRARLCDLLWEDRADEQARSSLRQSLAGLRRAFGSRDFPLNITDDAVALDLQAIKIDICRLNGTGMTEDVDGLAYAEFLEGVNLPGQAIQDWLRFQRTRFNALYCDALGQRINALEAAGLQDAALVAARLLVDADPLNENAHRALIRLLAATGHRSAALQHYKTCCKTLRTELGIDPEPATRSLYETVRDNGSRMATDIPALEPVSQHGIPSIVVLPFANLSGDPSQNYVCDGLTDSITTELSRFHDLLVIAGTTASGYRNWQGSVPDICKELRVGFALEGGVQRIGDRVRINVQLIGATTGQQLWSERYDRLFEDFFAIQDEVTETIVSTLGTSYGGRLRKAWQRQRTAMHPADIQVFDLFMRGVDMVDRFTFPDLLEGRALLLQALDIEPGYAKARAKLAWTYIIEAIEGWNEDHNQCMEIARETALEAIGHDDGESWGYWALAACNIFSRQYDLGLEQTEQVLKLNPNDADVLADYGYFLSFCGRAGEGIEHLHKAMRLNPHHPDWYLLDLVQVYFDARRYDDAVKAFARLRSVRTQASCLLVAASHAAMGNEDLASRSVRMALEMDPQVSLSRWVDGPLLPYRKQEDRQHLRALLARAGVPE